MSIVRMGMSEDGKYGAGYDAIFGKGGAKKPATKPAPAAKPAEAEAAAEAEPAAEKPAQKKE